MLGGSQEDPEKVTRKKKLGLANLGVDDKDDGSDDEGEELDIPEGAPTYEECLKELGYNLFTCGFEPQGGDSELQGGVDEISVNSNACKTAPGGEKTISWADRVRAVSYTHLTLPTICSV